WGSGPAQSTGKSWPHFRPSAVDFCCSRLAIGAATERARALAMPAGTRAPALQTRLLRRRACFTAGRLPRALALDRDEKDTSCASPRSPIRSHSFVLAGTRSDRRCLVERSGFGVCCR